MINSYGKPFIMGVSGHRDLPEFNSDTPLTHPNIELEATRALTHWLNKLDSTIPVWLYSGCAQGADLLVIRAAEAINRQDKYRNRIRIFPVLAMPAKYLEQDFNVKPDSQYGLDYFKLIIQKYGSDLIVVEHTLSEDEYESATKAGLYENLRNTLYLTQSCFIAKYSHILLAIWNGETAQPSLTNSDEQAISGGTSDAVHYAMNHPVHGATDYLPKPLHQKDNLAEEPHTLIHQIKVFRSKSPGYCETPVEFTQIDELGCHHYLYDKENN